MTTRRILTAILLSLYWLNGSGFTYALEVPGPIPPEPGVEHSREVILEYERDVARYELKIVKDRLAAIESSRRGRQEFAIKMGCVVIAITIGVFAWLAASIWHAKHYQRRNVYVESGTDAQGSF